MENKKYIHLILLSSFLMITPAAFAWINHGLNIPGEQTQNIHPFELDRQSFVLAENDIQPTKENQDQVPAPKTAESDKEGSASDDAATKPLKPFKPSEEIAAEQAVDFPVDI
jgi:hypothetical protein